jgi:hypothetical protein
MEVPSWDTDRQQLRNRWAVPPRFTSARYPEGPIPVTARLVWTRDGVEWKAGRAMGWTRRLVLVELVDARLQINGVWLEAHDVRRRG